MDALKRQALLEELTPEIMDYLFPGMTGIEHYEVCRDDVFYGSIAPEPEMMAMKCSIALDRKPKPDPKPKPKPKPDPDRLDPKTKALLDEIERIQKKYGVSIEELEVIMGYKVTLSTMRITRQGGLFLQDFDFSEVKMDNVSKALYFLYLRHPEGIRFKEVSDHREELLGIYRSICGRDDPREIEKSINHLVNPLGNALNVASSRIKIAFRNVVSDRVARFYYINGSAGEVKKVPLDRDLVLWDY